MALTKFRIGDLIEQRREKYNGKEILPIRGVTRDGFIPPKQKVADTTIYNVFYKNDFVFNPARMELNSIALNKELEKAICSSLYEIFFVKREDIILPEYLNLFIKREEFARRCWFNAIGSARNYFRVPDLSEFEIEIPSIDIQKKYVAIYNGLLANLHSYEDILDDLKIVCDGYIEDLRRKNPAEAIGKYIADTSMKNNDLNANIVGISKEQKFISSDSRTQGVDKTKYYIVKSREFAYSPIHINDGSIAFNDTLNTYVVSPIYRTFNVVNENLLNSKYLMMWFSRSEFIRYCWFHAYGSARDSFDWNQLCDVKIPIPSIEIQKSVVKVYNALIFRKQKIEELKKKIQKICPILIRGSILEATGEY